MPIARENKVVAAERALGNKRMEYNAKHNWIKSI
jgi:hypothetical protein